MNPTPFLVLAEPRSGTTFLNSVLRSHPDIVVHGEIMPGLDKDSDFHHWWAGRVAENPEDILLPRVPYLFSDYLAWLQAEAKDAAAVGVDVKYYQAEWMPHMLEIFQRRDFKVLHVVRRNLLKRYISATLHVPTMRQKLDRPMHTGHDVRQVRIPVPAGPELIQLLERMTANVERYRQLVAANFDVLEMAYEDMVDPAANSVERGLLERVYDLLGVKNREAGIFSTMRKTNANLLRHLCANYAQVVETLHGTPWQDLLDSPDYDRDNAAVHEMVNQAWEHLSKHRLDQARDLLDQAMAASDMPEPHFLSGLTSLVLGLRDQGIEEVGRAVDMAKGDRDILNFYRIMLNTSGLTEQSAAPALELVQAALGEQPAD